MSVPLDCQRLFDADLIDQDEFAVLLTEGSGNGRSVSRLENYDQLRKELDALKAWKAEQLTVEASWDEQAVGKALGIPLGKSVRANILPAIQKLEADKTLLKETGNALKASYDAVIVELQSRVKELEQQLNTPELHDFSAGVVSEAQHQRARWGSDHDAVKSPEDWFWLVGYLGGKALRAHLTGDTDKALHHTISTAAALANWHAAILGQTSMRPGISWCRRDNGA